MAERWGLCPDHESVVDPITGRASATCQCRPVTAPDPTLADRLEEARALSMLCGATGTAISHADAKAAAVRLRKLDRIEVALGDVWTADEIRWAVGDGRVVKMAYHPLDEMLRRLADALDEGDQ